MLQFKQMEEVRVLEMEQLHQKEEENKNELVLLKQKLSEINEEFGRKVEVLDEKAEKRMKTNKILLFSLLGTQVGMIVLGVLGYFS